MEHMFFVLFIQKVYKLKCSIFQLHTNLKAVEGSVSCPIVGVSTAKKPRKSKNNNSEAVSTVSDPYAIDSMDDTDLPTQVKLRSIYSPLMKQSLPGSIGTPTGDKSRSGSRTTLPLPMTFPQGIPSPLELRTQHGQDSFIASLSEANQFYQGNFSHHLFAHNSAIMSHTQVGESQHNGKSSDDARQKELLQATLQNNSEKGYTTVKQSHPQPSYSPMPDLQNQDRRMMSPHSPDSRQRSNHDSRQLSNHDSQQLSNHDSRQISNHDSRQLSNQDSRQLSNHNSRQLSNHDSRQLSNHDSRQLSNHPSHITHHFPKPPPSSTTISRSESQNIFNPAFTSADSSVRQSSYRSNQY